MRTLKRHLQYVYAVVATSPSSPRPSLTRCSQDHKFDTSNMPSLSMKIPHYIGFVGLTTMERITHQIH
jgi:hypothetical protein